MSTAVATRKEHPKVLSDAITKLIMGDVFFTARFYALKVIPFEKPFAAGTDGVTLYYNEALFGAYSLTDRATILCHEILHVVLMHSLRRGGRDPETWNIAADHVVNLILQEAGKQIPSTWYADPQYKGMNSEQVYDLLIKNGVQKGHDFMADVLDYVPGNNDGISAEQVVKQIQMDNAKAGATAKAAGKLNNSVARMLSDANVTKLPWFTILSRFVTRTIKNEFNWARINHRRAISYGGVLCPMMKSDSLGEVVFGVDCSGSITSKQLSAISTHIKHLVRECLPAKVTVLYFTHQVNKTDHFESPFDTFALSPGPSGGTDFGPVIKEVNDKYSDATLLIMFTDLYGPCDQNTAVPTIWVTDCPNNPIPFGEKIEADFND